MINVPINYVAVILAAVANMVMGFLWFGPIFGKQWIKMMGITPQQIEEAKKKGMTQSYIIAFVGSFITAWVLAELAVFVESYLLIGAVAAGLKAGFLGWLGFTLLPLLNSVAWEGKSWNLWFLNASYYLVALMVMGAIVSWM